MAITVVAGWAAAPLRAEQAIDEETARGIFADYVEPLFKRSCYECHSHAANKAKGGLVLDSRSGWAIGGDSGPAIVPGDPESSLLMEVVSYVDLDLAMPPREKLSEREIEHLRDWISGGAPDPRQGMAAEAGGEDGGTAVSAEELWSLQPVVAVDPPAVSNEAWPKQAVDRFVLSALEARGLSPSREAEASRLLRRLHFDLVGLPPTPEALEKFLVSWEVDPDQAVSNEVDALLASPHFGERWGRHWLDVVRYAETNGKAWNMTLPYAWRYREYVIEAFNRDLPWDRFLVEQVAGDLLPSEGLERRNRQLTATGYLALGSKTLYEKVEDIERERLEWVDEQIDMLGKSILGLSIGCARCHDHKFDPIPTRDYYAMAGIFLSTEILSGPKKGEPGYWRQERPFDDMTIALGPEEKVEKARAAYATYRKVQSEIQTAEKKAKDAKKAKKAQTEIDACEARVAELEVQLPKLKKAIPKLEFTFGVREGQSIGSTQVRTRGVWDKLGEEAPRGTLSAIGGPEMEAIPEDASGRLQLAQWLTHPDHPLTARVAVNRMWAHLFGRGLVETVDNFGANGGQPSHPELLDHLAHRFTHTHGWSVKAMIREMVTSRTYRQSTVHAEASYAVDPENVLLWRARPRRLEAEAIRDSLLMVGGRLDLSPLRGSAAGKLKAPYTMLSPGDVREIHGSAQRRHRSVYLAVLRGQPTDDLFSVFDFPDPAMVIGRRNDTTVSVQSLYMMNSPLVLDSARGLATRVLEEALGRERSLDQAFARLFARKPSAEERDWAASYLASASGSEEERWASLLHALMMSSEFRYLY